MLNKRISKRIDKIIVLILGLLVGQLGWARSFDDWRADFAEKARLQGISVSILAKLAKIKPYEHAIDNDNNQSEFGKFIWDYLNSAVSVSRVSNGQQKIRQYRQALAQMMRQSGVAPEFMVAIWGIESSYGRYTGKVPVVASLAALAFAGRRGDFFTEQLMTLLKLIDDGDVPRFDVSGSWAGGLGMTQFIPSSYEHYAVDFDGDGHRNLWQPLDALASTAHYLAAMGWHADGKWGREVNLPEGFDYLLANDRKTRLSLSEWSALGVTAIDGAPLPKDAILSRLYVPAGQHGPKFLLYHNFDVIKRYNNADAYALAVSVLSERIAGRVGIVGRWPNNAQRIDRQAVMRVQQALLDNGFDSGTVDGVLGNQTQRALQAYQAKNAMVADGFLSVELYHRLTATIP